MVDVLPIEAAMHGQFGLPPFPGHLVGRDVIVECNGVRIAQAIGYRSGIDGFVYHYQTTDDGQKMEIGGTPFIRKITGEVRVFLDREAR